MKKFMLLVIMAFICQVMFSQKEFAMKNGVYIVLDNEENSEYNKIMTELIPKYWTACKYKFISLKEYESSHKEKIGNICLITYDRSWTSSDAWGVFTSRAMRLLSWRPDYIDKYNKTGEDIIHDPNGMSFRYSKAKKNGEITELRNYTVTKQDYIILINYFQNAIFCPFPNLSFQGAGTIDKARNDVMNKKTFVVSETEMKRYGLEEEKVKKSYKYPFEVVTDEKLKEIIEKKDPKYVFMRSGHIEFTNLKGEIETIPDKESREMLVIDAETGFVLYAISRIGNQVGIGNLGAFRR
jgi:hypothetical protein